MAILELYLGGFGQSTFNTAAFDTTLLGVPFKVASSNGDSIPIRPNAQNAGFVASAWTASGLPLGVTLVYKNGSWFFTGAPTQSGTFNILLTVTANGQQSIEGPFRVYVRNHPAHVAKNQTFSGKFNESFNGALAVLDPVNAPLGGLTWEVGTGITYGPNTWTENFSKWYGSSWVVNNLPPGLSLNQNTGTITGTPTKAGTFTPVISLVNNSGYRAPSEYASFTVQAGAPYIPNDQSVTTKYGNYFSKTFSVLDSANRPVTSWSSPDLPPGLTLNATTGALSGYINESNIALIQDRKRASYDPLYIGSFYVTLLAAGPGGTSSPTRIWLDVQYGTPKIIPAQIFNGTRGVAFSAAIAMDGDIYRPAYRWAATSPLPAGLILNPDTGAISGTPLNRESKTASLTATGDGGTGGTTVSFIIEAPYSAPIITAGQTFTGKVGSAFSATPAITDAIERPVTSWAGTALPSWATINATTGQITGTPSAIGAFNFELTATGPGGVSTGSISVTIGDRYSAPIIAAGQTFNGKVGSAFSATPALTDSANRPATNWSATGLPSWATLNATTGAITGTPQDIAGTTITLTATGSGGTSAATTAIIGIGLGAPNILAGQTFTGKVGEAFTSPLPSLEDPLDRPASSWAITGLPVGLVFNAPSGAITGTPTTKGTINANFVASGFAGTSAVTPVTFTISAGVPIIPAGQNATGKVGVPFSKKYTASDTDNRPVTSWASVSLPTWATLNSATGEVTGTPTTSGTFPISLTATGSGGTSAATTAIIGIGLGAPNILAGQTFTGKVGEAFTSPLPSLEDPLDRPASSWAITGLPVGLVFNAPSGAITGTPTTKGTINANFVASGFAGTSAVTPVTFTISAGVPIIPAGQNATGKVGVPFSKKYTASDTDNRPVTSWASVSLPTWATLNSATGEVTGTPTTSGTFPISLTATGSGGTSSVAEFSIVTGNGAPLITPGQTFTGKVGEAFSATAALTDAASRPATMWGFGGLPAGLTPNYTTGEITGTPTTKGSFTANFAAIGSGGTSTQSTVTFTIAGGAPLIPAGQTLHGKVGAAFSVTPALTDSTNRPVNSWSATGLPAGLSINALTGEITGTPQDRATTTITLTASGTGGVGTATASLAIAAGTPVIVPGQKFTGKVGAAFSFTPSITDTLNFPATSWAASSLPTWATLNATTGTITGTPTKKGEAVVNLSASGAGGTSAVTPVTFTIAAAYPAPIITAGQSFTGKVGDVFPAITPALTDAAALPATSWSATSLPSGLEINATTGAITGTPTQSGAFSFSIAALSVEGESVESVAFTIAFGSPQIIPGQKLSIVQTEPFSAQLQGADESDRPISAWTSSDIPSWATLESDGRVHGTPPASGQFTFAVTATGPGGTDTDTVLLESSVEIPVIATTLVDVKVGVLHESFFTTTEPASMPVSFWGVTGTLPAGLSLDPTTGRLFGTPQAVGTSAVSTYAQNSAGKGSATISIVVAPGVPIVSAQEFYGAAGKDFDATLQAQDTTYRPASTWSIAPALPSGLALDTATGTITGNLTNPVRFSATLTATGAGGTASAALTIDIGAPIIAPIDAKVDFALDAVVAFTTATITSGRSKVESWTASSLPTGITFKDGVFLGRAQASGTYQITVTTQNKWDTSNAKVTFVVAQGAPIIAAGQKFSAKTDSKADFEVGLVNKSSRPATKWTAQGTLPRGLGLSQDGRISGTPSQNFTGTITLIAESPLGKSSASIAIAIKGPIFYGDKNPILQPGRVVKTFPSGLVMVSEVYKMRPINEAAARSRFAQGQTLVTSSTSSTALKIFPAPDFKSQDSGFVEMVVTAYGFTGADFRRTRKRMQSAKMLTKVLEVPEGGGAPTFQGKYSESNIQILANTHTITRAVAYATGVTPIAGAHGVSSLGGYTSVISPVTERYDVTAFGEVDEVTVTTAYEVTFTQQ